MNSIDNIVVYNTGEIELKISIDNDTIWLNQVQLSELFDTSVDNVSLHLKNIYKEGELDENRTVEYFSIVRKEGNRNVKRRIKHYNLDAVISLGYRINSKQATRFRQWATKILKEYIHNGYAINSEKITHQRFKELENDVALLKSKVDLLEDKTIKPTEGIFYDGQIFDAYIFINDLIKSAKHSIKLIDNYIDETTLTLFSKVPDVEVTIYTQAITKQLRLDYEKYKKQYHNITLKSFKNAHDRFLIIDDTEIYHIGASLKDLGKKWFAFSKMSGESLSVLGRLK